MDSTILSGALESLASELARERKRISGVYRLFGAAGAMEYLECYAKWLINFVRGTKGREEELGVRDMMTAINDLVYEAQDIIERHVDLVEGRREIRRFGVLTKLHRHALDAIVLIKMKSEIKALYRKVCMMIDRMADYGIKPIHSELLTYANIDPVGEPSSHIIDEDEAIIVGLDGDIKTIANLLISEASPWVIGVCGVNGIGKTTLVKEVLKRSDINEHFEFVVWVFFGPDLQPEEALKKVLLCLQSDLKLTDEEQNRIAQNLLGDQEEDSPSEIIAQILGRRRCLVILDDLQTRPAGCHFTWRNFLNSWDPTYLRDAFSPFRSAESSSKLVVTTCDPSVLSRIDSQGYLHLPKCLNSEERWQLLRLKATSVQNSISGRRNNPVGFTSDMLNEGKATIKSCRGLPFTIHVLGGLLAYDFQSFNSYEAPVVDLCHDSNVLEDEVDAVLKLSDSSLPRGLRSCLIEMAIHYSEGEEIPTADLIRFWKEKGTPEDVGQSNLYTLVDRGLIQVVEKKGLFQPAACQLHSLVNHFYH